MHYKIFWFFSIERANNCATTNHVATARSPVSNRVTSPTCQHQNHPLSIRNRRRNLKRFFGLAPLPLRPATKAISIIESVLVWYRSISTTVYVYALKEYSARLGREKIQMATFSNFSFLKTLWTNHKIVC